MITDTAPLPFRASIGSCLALASALFVAASAGLAGPAPLGAQDDVVALGARHGTTPPAGYFERIAADPEAFTFGRAWLARHPGLELEGAETDVEVPRVVTGPGLLGRRPGEGEFPRAMAAASAVSGTLHVPMFLGRFADGGAPLFDVARVQDRFFRGPNPTGTVPEYYAEISGGRLRMVGETFDWHGTSLTKAQVTGGESGLGSSSRVGEFIVQLLVGADRNGIDWGRYDNDGPDGIPNSGDDDGYVDVIAVMHQDSGGECGREGSDQRIWSHRWRLRSATGQAFVTSTPSARGGWIRVDDYTVQPVLDCAGTGINDIGVLAHELGHGLGLPDLYAVGDGSSRRHRGIGEWGVMGGGSWGCPGIGNGPARPCWMSAWSRAQLGWSPITVLDPGVDYGEMVLDPVENGGAILMMDIPDTNDYWLLENRQRIGYDAGLVEPGLLVWQVDRFLADARGRGNRVNSDPDRMGVRLVEADGENHLTRNLNSGDGGDPFPGTHGRRDFHAGSTPAARAYEGHASGLTVEGVSMDGLQMRFRLRTTRDTLTLRAENDAVSDDPLFIVDGVPRYGTPVRIERAPWDVATVTAAGGRTIAEGVRSPFVGWADGGTAPTRTVTFTGEAQELVARFDGEEVRILPEIEGAAFGVEPGQLVSTPTSEDLWFARGTEITLTARPATGFEFLDWIGSRAGSPNPLVLTLDDPVNVGARFGLTYGVAEVGDLGMAAGDDVAVVFEAVDANGVVSWERLSGSLPIGLELAPGGTLHGVPLHVGTFISTLRAVDEAGLEATVRLEIEVAWPELSLETLGGAFMPSGNGPTAGQRSWLDRVGNDDGLFDVGDVRRYLLTGAPVGATTIRTDGTLRTRIRIASPRTGANR